MVAFQFTWEEKENISLSLLLMSRGLCEEENRKRKKKKQITNKSTDLVMEKHLIVQKESSVEEENVDFCIDMAVKCAVPEIKKSSHVQRLIK